MWVYRDAEEWVAPAQLLKAMEGELRRLSALGHADVNAAEALFIEFGAFEAAFVDHECPSQDRVNTAVLLVGEAMLAFARMLRAALLDGQNRAPQALAHVDRIARLSLPSRLALRVPEGYAYYALFPELYRRAAGVAYERFAPVRTTVIGLRSIGTGLSALVAAELAARGCETERCTLRPHGLPFDRKPVVSDALARRWASDPGRLHIIVDEGPGLSGSSMCGTAALLEACGIPASHIALMPAWDPPAERFCSPDARTRWSRHAHVLANVDAELFAAEQIGCAGLLPMRNDDWRARLSTDASGHPASHPQHARMKFVGGEPVCPRLFKFAGLGRYGEARMRRARTLQAAGFTPPVHGLGRGFIESDWIAGGPWGTTPASTPEHLAEYLALLHRSFATGAGCDAEPLAAMLEANAREAFGDAAMDLPETRGHGAVPAVWSDGRLLPHEWIDTGAQLLKSDALDHGNDHFLPGPTDIAWDLAGAIIELPLGRNGRARLLDRYSNLTGDRRIAARLPFYRAAYLAFRLGYTTMAAKGLEGGEALRFTREAGRYRRLLALELRVKKAVFTRGTW